MLTSDLVASLTGVDICGALYGDAAGVHPVVLGVGCCHVVLVCEYLGVRGRPGRVAL